MGHSTVSSTSWVSQSLRSYLTVIWVTPLLERQLAMLLSGWECVGLLPSVRKLRSYTHFNWKCCTSINDSAQHPVRETSIILSCFTDEETGSASDLPQAAQHISRQLGLPQRSIPMSLVSPQGRLCLPCQQKARAPGRPKERPSHGQAPQRRRGLLEKGSCT